MRFLLCAEFIIAVYNGHFVPWFFQYFFSLWFNTCLVVSSHDFEEAAPSNQDSLSPQHRDDWGVLQMSNCFDFTLCGNRWFDLFFSAGLSCHRVHHLFPYQKSGFSNLICEDLVKKTCLEFGLPWDKPRNMWTQRLPVVLKHYLFYPAINPRTGRIKDYGEWSMRSMMDAFTYMFLGFAGIGAV